ncbi:MAG: hypothetical protein ACI4XS_00665 [Bacillus sp. (in: firmicutes)]
MLGILLTELEKQEIEYLVKRELDELLYDFEDRKIEGIVKRAMEERYRILFKLYAKVASPAACSRYVRNMKFY